MLGINQIASRLHQVISPSTCRLRHSQIRNVQPLKALSQVNSGTSSGKVSSRSLMTRKSVPDDSLSKSSKITSPLPALLKAVAFSINTAGRLIHSTTKHSESSRKCLMLWMKRWFSARRDRSLLNDQPGIGCERYESIVSQRAAEKDSSDDDGRAVRQARSNVLGYQRNDDRVVTCC